ncbi:MAG: ATP-dependent DNA helicase RecG [Oscillospiraceae bacterium]|nr:ATP-dependent DNA helicase RecG [Oscillospiraceae bacterium]
MLITDKITDLGGIGSKRAALYEKLDIFTIGDLLEHYPTGYIDLTEPEEIDAVTVNEYHVVEAVLTHKQAPERHHSKLIVYKAVIEDDSGAMSIVFYNNRFALDALTEEKCYRFYGKVAGNFTRREMVNPVVVASDTKRLILPKYHLTKGLTQNMVAAGVTAALDAVKEQIREFIPDEIRSQYRLCSEEYAVNNIHFPENMRAAELSRHRLGFDELFVMQCALRRLRNTNRGECGVRMNAVPLEEFEESLPFELTAAQKRTCNEVYSDMEKESPMNRLVQGDVGSGKTAVAAAACYMCVKNGFQAAFMAPTEILANQHYNTLKAFLEPLSVRVECLTGSLTPAAKRKMKERLAAGEIDVVTGTHALISDSTEFAALGLIITDEQHRFGVEQRKRLAEKGDHPHRLVMSATPIPRTLALIMYGDLDVSVIDELPKGRQRIQTYAVTGKLRERALSFVRQELDKGRQGYIVCPMIEDEEGFTELQAVTDYAQRLQRGILAGYSTAILHGKMTGAEKDSVMADFKAGQIQLLVSTTVVEVGVDVPNATVMLIEDADRFGLSQLHQLRGRVGRGSEQSYCILVTENPTPEVRDRLRIISENSDGFAIAEADLRLRGAGDFFGSRQHGLPPVKIADLAADSTLLKETSDAADAVLRDDPNLDRQPLLRKKTNELTDRIGSEGMN